MLLVSLVGGLGVIWTPRPSKITPYDTQIFLNGIYKNVNYKHAIEHFHLNIIQMIMTPKYFWMEFTKM